MNCNEIHKQLIFYIEGNLNQDLSFQIEEHLRECDSCNNFAESMRESLSVIDFERQTQMDPDFYGRVINRMESARSFTISPYRRIVQFTAAAAVIIFGIFSGFNIANYTTAYHNYYEVELSDEYYYMNDTYQEPIENFFLLDLPGYE